MDNDYALRLTELRARFVSRAASDRRLIALGIEAEQWDEVRRLCHGLAGIAGTFGFEPVGDAAYELEETIDSGSEPSVREAAWGKLDRLLAEAASSSAQA